MALVLSDVSKVDLAQTKGAKKHLGSGIDYGLTKEWRDTTYDLAGASTRLSALLHSLERTIARLILPDERSGFRTRLSAG